MDYEINSSDLLEDIVALYYSGNMIFRYKLLWPLIRFIGLCYCDKAGYALSLVILSTPSSNKRSVEYIMAEVIIARGGIGGGSSGNGNGDGLPQHIVMIKTNMNWVAPDNITGEAHIICYGAGGGGACNNNKNNGGGGGGGGWFNEIDVALTPGASYTVTIGAGGGRATWNNSSKSYSHATSGGTTSFGTILSASGGSFGNIVNGGSGGSGGGAGCRGSGGTGYQFGGGGYGGNGGIWGGAGSLGKTAGTFGGTPGNNGTRVDGINYSYSKYFKMLTTNNLYGGGLSLRSNGSIYYQGAVDLYGNGAGGGGYGGNSPCSGDASRGCGGGGYGADGGLGNSSNQYIGAGGGGYGGKGQDCYDVCAGGGGGGFFEYGGWGGSGDHNHGHNGGNGVCVIFYNTK